MQKLAHYSSLNWLDSFRMAKVKTQETELMENDLEQINKAALKFLLPLTPEKTYATIVEEALKLVNGDEGLIILKNEAQLVTVYGSSPHAGTFIPRKRGFAYRAYKTKKAFVIHTRDFVKTHPEMVKTGIKSILFIPIYYKEESIGVLVIRSYKPNKFFNKKELKILELFGSFATMAIRKTQLYEELTKAIQMRDLFISMAAHELRTPITTINGYTQLIKSKVTKENFPQYKWFEELSWEVIRLTHLVNELLEINKIKAGQFLYNWKTCNIVEIVQRALKNLGFAYPNRKFMLENKIQGKKDHVVGDFDKLLQVITNLLKNAARFSANTTDIHVKVYYRAKFVVVEVRDFGKGIASEDLPRVFEEFYKGKNTEEEGMGIGLYLVKNIIQQHHGKIDVKTKEGKGTTVVVKLPQAKYE